MSFNIIIQLDKDQPFFEFQNIRLEKGIELNINLEETPQHGDLIVTHQE